MKLQEKTSLILVAVLIVLLSLISIFVSFVSLSSYSALEHRYVMQDVDQGVSRLHSEYATLSSIASDWGQWDDTYAFAKGDMPGYVGDNLIPGIYENLQVNLIVIANRDGDILYAGAYDLRNHTYVQVPAALRVPLARGDPLMNMTNPVGSNTGILMLDGKPVVVASTPILHSDLTGPADGVVIMGRSLDSGGVAGFMRMSGRDIGFTAADDPSIPPDLLAVLADREGGTRVFVTPLEDNKVAGYTLVPDIYGRDALVLRVLESRDIYQQGVTSTLQFVLIVLGAGLVFGIAILLIIERLVLSRVSSLSRQVQEIGRQIIPSGRITVEGGDEFSDLSSEINLMLETIEKTHDGLMQSEARFRELAELLPQIIFEMDRAGILTYVNRAGIEIFGIDEGRFRKGIAVGDFLIQEDLDRMHQGLSKVFSGGLSGGEIWHLKRPNGSIMSAIVYTALIIRNGTPTGFRGIVIDITDRVRLEEALIESQEYLQTLLWSVRAGIVVIDAETHTIIDANPAALDMIGTTKDQLIGRSCHAAICPADKGRCPLTDLHQAVDNSERELVRADGTRISIIKYVVPVMLQGRSCLLETFIDNTARKISEQELRESRDLINGILQASPVGVFRLDSGGCITFVNEMFTTISGISQEEVQGQPWIGLFHPDDRESILREQEAALRDRRMMNIETRFIRADGSIYWLLGQAVPLLDAGGCITGWVGSIDDITERKKMEVALRESQERLSSILRASPVGVFETRADGTLLYVNKRWEEMVGMTLETLKTSKGSFYREPLDSTRISRDMWMKFVSRLQPHAESRFMRPDGTIIWIYGQAVPMHDPEGNIRGYVGTITDISDRKRNEDAIQLANKKLNLMNDITRHDILNTLTGIFGLVDMAVASDNRQELARLLVQIKDVGRVIQRQITFTRDYQGVGVNAPVWQNVRDVAARATMPFSGSGLTIQIDIEDTEVFADPLLEKVFYNLADNAIRYGEHVTVIRFFYQISDHGIALICEDDGVGVPPEAKDRIFERGVGKNTGMGLFLTREILLITGITIRENGIPGKGARFEMLIPNGMWRFVRQQEKR